MNIQQIAKADYLDILFDGRNKAYGAFELRRNYAQRTKRALAGVLAVVAVATAYPLFASKGNHSAAIRVINIDHHLSDIASLPKPKEPLHVTVPPHVPPPVAPTATFKPPVIVDNNLVTIPPKSIDSLEGRMIGAIDTKGDPGGLIAAIDAPHGKGDPNLLVEAPKDTKAAIYTTTTVDQNPEFKGDLGSWLSDHLEYPDAAREANIQGKVEVQFIVAEDGSISDVKVLGGPGHGLDAEAARVVKMMPRWKPGKLNGEAVRTYFKLPVQFVLSD